MWKIALPKIMMQKIVLQKIVLQKIVMRKIVMRKIMMRKNREPAVADDDDRVVRIEGDVVQLGLLTWYHLWQRCHEKMGLCLWFCYTEPGTDVVV
jgi:hypothetical protein